MKIEIQYFWKVQKNVRDIKIVFREIFLEFSKVWESTAKYSRTKNNLFKNVNPENKSAEFLEIYKIREKQQGMGDLKNNFLAKY